MENLYSFWHWVLIKGGVPLTNKFDLCRLIVLDNPCSEVIYMKYSASQGRISSFVVGKAGSENGLPVAVIS